MDKAEYEENQDSSVYIPYDKRELAQIINIDHWPKGLINEIEWFQFEGILEHADFHTKGDIYTYILLDI